MIHDATPFVKLPNNISNTYNTIDQECIDLHSLTSIEEVINKDLKNWLDVLTYTGNNLYCNIL